MNNIILINIVQTMSMSNTNFCNWIHKSIIYDIDDINGQFSNYVQSNSSNINENSNIINYSRSLSNRARLWLYIRSCT